MSFLERFIKNYQVEIKKYPTYLQTINNLSNFNDRVIDLLILKKYPTVQKAIYRLVGQHIPHFYFGKKYIFHSNNLFDERKNDYFKLPDKKNNTFFQKITNFIFKPNVEKSVQFVENRLIKNIFQYREDNSDIKQLYERILQTKNLFSFEIFDLKSTIKNKNTVKTIFQVDIFAKNQIVQYACELYYDMRRGKITEFIFNKQ